MQQQSRQVGVLVCKSELQGYSSYSELNSRNISNSFNARPNLSEENEFGLWYQIDDRKYSRCGKAQCKLQQTDTDTKYPERRNNRRRSVYCEAQLLTKAKQLLQMKHIYSEHTATLEWHWTRKDSNNLLGQNWNLGVNYRIRRKRNKNK